MSQLTVLLVEDQSSDARLIMESLEPIVNVRWETDLTKCHDVGECDVVLLDLMLPTSKSVQTVVQARQMAPNKPIIVLTHISDPEIQAQCLQYGADYFFRKGEQDVAVILRAMEAAIAAFQIRMSHRGEIEATKAYLSKASELISEINVRLRKISGEA